MDDEAVENANALGKGGKADGEGSDRDIGEVIGEVHMNAECQAGEPCGEGESELGEDRDDERPAEEAEMAAVGMKDLIGMFDEIGHTGGVEESLEACECTKAA